MKIYQLTSENLQGLGGPMGTERTTVNWVKPFESLETAQAYAENDYEGKEKLKWSKVEKSWHSQDLSWVMYHIHEVELGGVKDVQPKMLGDDKIKLDDLKKVVADYMKDLHSDNPSELSDWKQYIYEECLKALYGKKIFDHINTLNR
jgi:hypothetical protein